MQLKDLESSKTVHHAKQAVVMASDGKAQAAAKMANSKSDAYILFQWQAHGAAIVSIRSCNSPPGLVTIDSLHNCRMWSPNGQLWCSFDAHRGVLGDLTKQPTPFADGRPREEPENGFACVWPPPQVLAAQLKISQDSKIVCDALGMKDQSLKKKFKNFAKILGRVEIDKKKVTEKIENMKRGSLDPEQKKKLEEKAARLARTDTLTMVKKGMVSTGSTKFGGPEKKETREAKPKLRTRKSFLDGGKEFTVTERQPSRRSIAELQEKTPSNVRELLMKEPRLNDAQLKAVGQADNFIAQVFNQSK